MSTATVVLPVKNAMETAIRTAIAAADPNGRVLVDWGYPTQKAPPDMILIMRATSPQTYATMGTNRSREETITLEVHFLSWRSDQRQADTAAWQWAAIVEDYCRMTDPYLGGTVRECLVTNYDSDGYTKPGDNAAGRGCEIIATFTARNRISG